jgi:hypothetical protein
MIWLIMETNNYNQYTDYTTKNACGIVTYLNILKYRYAITVYPNYIIKMAVFFDKLWIFSITWWAVFSILYKWITTEINKKLGLNFKVVVNQISKLRKDDGRTYWLWIKKYSSKKYGLISEDWVVTKKEMDYLVDHNLWIWHNVAWDWTKGWYFIDTNWSKNFKFSLENLKYWQTKDLFWDTIRTIEPNDAFTKKVCHYTIRLFQAEKKGKYNEFIEANKGNKYIGKAVELYEYWK